MHEARDHRMSAAYFRHVDLRRQYEEIDACALTSGRFANDCQRLRTAAVFYTQSFVESKARDPLRKWDRVKNSQLYQWPRRRWKVMDAKAAVIGLVYLTV